MVLESPLLHPHLPPDCLVILSGAKDLPISKTDSVENIAIIIAEKNESISFFWISTNLKKSIL
jgi:hypothetical protein